MILFKINLQQVQLSGRCTKGPGLEDESNWLLYPLVEMEGCCMINPNSSALEAALKESKNIKFSILD